MNKTPKGKHPNSLKNLRPGWKPGQSGNPGGPLRLSSELRALRRENTASLIKLVSRYLSFTEEQADQRMAMPDLTMVELGICRLMTKACKDGDVISFKYLMEIMCGKIPDSEDEEQKPIETMTLQEKFEVLKAALKVMKLQLDQQKDEDGSKLD